MSRRNGRDIRIRHTRVGGRGLVLRRPPLMSAAALLSALTADFRHVLSISTHNLAALSAGGCRFFGGKLVGRPLTMSSLASLTCDLTLLLWIHGGKATGGCTASLS